MVSITVDDFLITSEKFCFFIKTKFNIYFLTCNTKEKFTLYISFIFIYK